MRKLFVSAVVITLVIVALLWSPVPGSNANEFSRSRMGNPTVQDEPVRGQRSESQKSTNPHMGTWKLNEAKSKFAPGANKNHTVVYEAAGDDVKVIVDGTDGDGNATHNEWTGKFNRKFYPVTGDATSDKRSYKVVNNRTMTLIAKKGRKITLTGRIVASADGTSRTITTNGIDAKGKRFRNVAVYDKEFSRSSQGNPTGQAEPGTRCTRFSWPKEMRPDDETPSPGSRCTRFSVRPREGELFPNRPAKVGISSSSSYLSPGPPSEIKLKAIACDLDDDGLLYTYSTSGGRITGDGPNAVWNLSGMSPGMYFVTVEVDDGCGCISFASAEVTVAG